MDSSTRVGSGPDIQFPKNGEDPLVNGLRLQNERIKKVVGVVFIGLGIVLAALAVGISFGITTFALGMGSIVALIAGSILFFKGKEEPSPKSEGGSPNIVSTQLTSEEESEKQSDLDKYQFLQGSEAEGCAQKSVQIEEHFSSDDEEKISEESVASVQEDGIAPEQTLGEFITSVLWNIDLLHKDDFYGELLQNPLFKDDIKNCVEDYREKFKEAKNKYNSEYQRLFELLEEKRQQLISERDEAIVKNKIDVAKLALEYSKLKESDQQSNSTIDFSHAPANTYKLFRAYEILDKAEQNLPGIIKEIDRNCQEQIGSFKEQNYDAPMSRVERAFYESIRILKQNFQENVEKLLIDKPTILG